MRPCAHTGNYASLTLTVSHILKLLDIALIDWHKSIVNGHALPTNSALSNYRKIATVVFTSSPELAGFGRIY
jgi:hypothetical protein